jgi:hypothetical protein
VRDRSIQHQVVTWPQIDALVGLEHAKAAVLNHSVFVAGGVRVKSGALAAGKVRERDADIARDTPVNTLQCDASRIAFVRSFAGANHSWWNRLHQKPRNRHFKCRGQGAE